MANKGKIRLTKPALLKLMHLPENVDLADINLDVERDIVSLVLTSNEPVEGLTFSTQVGQSARISSYLSDLGLGDL